MITSKTEITLKQRSQIDRVLSLYDKYGSLAYGVILQIIPNEKNAQEILVELFNSSELLKCSDGVSEIACIIRVSRTKALEHKHRYEEVLSNTPESVKDKHNWTPELIFNLAFKQGLSLESIATKMDISKEDIMLAIRTHLNSFRKL